MRWVTERGWTARRWGGMVIGLALLCTLLAIALRTGEASGAEGDGCSPACVILIQVDGLEPKDVTQEATPYLWALAHPPAQGTPALSGRSGWIWQAPRGVMSTGTAPATASLLTGGYPEKTNVPADDFYGRNDPRELKPTHYRLGAGGIDRLGPGGFGDTPVAEHPDVAEPIGTLPIDNPIGLLRDARKDVGVFLGDPGLARLTGIAGTRIGPNWYPPGDEASATNPEQHFTGDPRLCPVPRYPDGGYDATQPGSPPDPEGPAFNPAHCPANDMTTLNKAVADLKRPENSAVSFNFIHLAELGAAKRLAALPRPTATDLSPPPPTPSQALGNMDTAIGTFLEQYVTNAEAATTGKWGKTVVMVVGTHGYQTTPIANRVPDPTDPAPTKDLSDFVAEYTKSDASGNVTVEKGSLRLVPQGTMATIYYGLGGKGKPENRQVALDAIKAELEGDALRAACAQRAPTSPDCVSKVSFVEKATPSWHLDTLFPNGQRSGSSGDLIVELGRGWAAGRAVGVPFLAETATDAQAGMGGQPVTNGNTGSSGGPQERAVAALINGPTQGSAAVRNLDTYSGSQAGVPQVKYYPISNGRVDPSDPDNPPPIPAPSSQPCPDTPTDPGGLTCANDPAKVGDDAVKAGHEAQPVTVDFAKTISALMRIPFESHPDQLQGRVLQEAFLNKLSTPCVSDCEPPPPPSCFDVAELTMNDQPVVVTLSCTDSRDAPLTYSILSPPTRGTLGPVQNNTVTYTPAGGPAGTDTFTYEATSVNGTSDVGTASIIIMEPPVVTRAPGFDFHGLVRGLKARVVDSRNRPYRRAPRGTTFSTIRVEGDFGKPEAAVTLTFYRKVTTKPRRKTTKQRRKRTSRRRSGRARGARVVRLKPIARFDPFVVKRGHVTMRLKVPRLFKPTYIGVTVREIAHRPDGRRRLSGASPCTRLKTQRKVRFRCTGRARGIITRIADAGRLHKRKGSRVQKRKGGPKRKRGGRSTPRRRG